MLKKIAGMMLTLILSMMLSLPMSTVWAQMPTQASSQASSQASALVELNRADQAALDGLAGIGAAMSKRILEERTARGFFKDWDDFQKRVKGVGEKSAVKLSAAGLRVEGKPKFPRNVPVMPVETPPAR